MRVELKGGKTAPRLLQDLIGYDPRCLPSTEFNILTEQPLQFEEGKPLPALVTGNSCRHEWALKDEQSDPPKHRKIPDSLSVYIIAAYCTQCRSHLELSLQFRGDGDALVPCPNKSFPLHHFIHRPEISQPRHMSNGSLQPEKENGWVDMQRFECSSPKCSAKLRIRFKPSRLRNEWVFALTDRSLINQRARKVIAAEPERFEGHAPPQPTEVLSNLYKYIDDAMKNGGVNRIPGHNKKWLLCLGEPCRDLLLYLGFTWDAPNWIPPRPEAAATTPFKHPLNILLNDVQKELHVLQSSRPDAERRGGTAQFPPISAMNTLRLALGCLEYDTVPQSRTIDLSIEEHPFHAALGTVGDFSDDLVTFTYHRQIDTDPGNTPYYLECLQVIGEGRKSEALQTLAAIEASSGKISLKDVREAYKEFGLEFPSLFLDDTIIGTFHSRISDAPRQEAELRRALKIIGQYRSSEKIQQIASNVVSNYEQAISWLGATEDIDDAFLVAMHCTKVHETPADLLIANQAVSIIAEHRNSSALKAWLATGVLGETEMDISRAYNRLEITDRTIDDETVLTAYNYHVSEAPSQRDDLRRALIAIAESRGSTLLQDFLDSGMVSSEYPLSEWPVGLENIGNTCYLNSLLQFYFTVKPLRDLVLNFDQYKMDIEGENLRNKRVGSRRVSRKEVERAQRFVYELQKLFKDMISASNAQVTPEQELARLTLISSITEEQIRRQSVLSGHRPSLGEIDGRPLHGPLPPALENEAEMKKGGQDHTSQGLAWSIEVSSEIRDSIVTSQTSLPPDSLPPSIETAEAEAQHNGDIGSYDDDSSDATLVVGDDGDQIMLDHDDKAQQKQILEDKENLPPNKTDSVRSITPEPQLQPLGESSPSRLNEQPQLSAANKDIVQNQEDAATIQNAGPPSRPPPFPPRPQPEEDKMADVEIGAQQDVTEVIANVLFQLQCAIKAESFDESGEQIDQIKNLFFAKQKSYMTNNQGLIRTKEDFISDIKIDVASGPRDIYAALDGAYDVQQVEYGGVYEPQYAAISQLPPVLQILVQRAQFDPEKKSSFKSNHHLELKETIYMDRYLDTDDEDLMQRREECWRWKSKLAQLQARKLELTEIDSNMDMSEILASTADYLRQFAEGTTQDEDPIEISDSLLQDIETASRNVKKELEDIDLLIKSLTTNIQSQFSDLRNIPYRLHSVFIHRGDVSSGHYWIYIHDFARKMWRKYNDGYVTEVKDTREIFERDDEKRPATPYFMVYIKDDLKDKLVEPICRNIVQVPREAPDVEMIDLDDNSQDQQRPIEVDQLANISNSYGNGSGWTGSEFHPPGSNWDSTTVSLKTDW